MRCDMCHSYIYKGTKFNARKTTVRNETYLGIEIFRFFIRCPNCSSEITFKTDPQNADYICEHGASRNFESWREEKTANEEQSYRKQMEEMLDPMKALENKTYDSKREVDILEALDEIQTRNAMHARADVNEVLARLEQEKKEKVETMRRQEEQAALEDDEQAKAVFRTADCLKVKRLLDEDVEQVKTEKMNHYKDDVVFKKPKVPLSRMDLGIVKKPVARAGSSSSSKPVAPAQPMNGLALVGDYGDSSSDE